MDAHIFEASAPILDRFTVTPLILNLSEGRGNRALLDNILSSHHLLFPPTNPTDLHPAMTPGQTHPGFGWRV